MLKILDCTLRDGGYYTNWDFDKELVGNYIKRISKTPVDYIEIGYRSPEKEGYLGEYFYLSESTIKKVKAALENTKIAIMLNAKDCINGDLKKLLEPCQGYVDMVRIAIDPKILDESFDLIKDIKNLGFDVAINLMYISKIVLDKELFIKIKNLEEYLTYLYLVDSYGSIMPDELKIIIERFSSEINIPLGFHGHNNIELALANTLVAIKAGVSIVDATLLGMGRGAGNLKLELFLSYLKAKGFVDFELNNLSKLIELFETLHKKYKWGTNLAYMISGIYSLPQKDVMEALEIDRYSLSGIVNHLKKSKGNKLPLFKENITNEKCLIVGGGNSVLKHHEAINEYLDNNPGTIIIHSTSKYLKLFHKKKNRQLFAVAGDELLKIEELEYVSHIDKFILEPSPHNDQFFHDSSKYFELVSIDFINTYHDSPFAISLQVALSLSNNDIFLIGYDGYVELNSKKELYLMNENQTIINKFIKLKPLFSYTQTKYLNIECKSIYSELSNV